jgi:hypothetical protein
MQKLILMPENQESDCRNLRDHFDFAEFGSADRESLRRRNTAQPTDGEFSPYNDDHHPGWNDLELNEGNERCRNQQLVCDRIQENAKCCNLTPLSGQIAVEEIRQRCRKENECGNDHVILGQEEDNQQWDRKNTDQS